MKITGFRPIIITKEADNLISLFEELGFERKHKKTNIGETNVTSVAMKNESGFRVVVSEGNSIPQDITAIAINVDDFDEAYEFLTKKGFKDVNGGKVTDTGSSKATLMISPTGFAISLSQHIKN